MKAVVCTRYGSPDVLRFEEVDTPVAGDGEVLVKVHAVSINDWDLGLVEAKPWVNRVLNGFFRPRRHILGSDIAGRVVAVGANVTEFREGDAVFGDLTGTWGGFAEYVSAPATALVHKPDAIGWADAAAIPQAATLAYQGLHDRGRLQPGQSLLINGAGGGVGTFGVQLAKLAGVVTTAGVDSVDKLDLLRELGFDHVMDYRTEDFTRSGQRYDLVLDVKTNRSVFSYLRVLAPGGRYITIGGSMPRIFQATLLGPLIRMVAGKSTGALGLKTNQDLALISSLCEEGEVKPVIDETTWSLSQVPDALRHFAAARHQGKVVVTVVPEE